MPLTLTSIFEDNFHRANENPLTISNWAAPEDGNANLQIINNACVGTDATNDCEQLCKTALPNDQFVQATLAAPFATDFSVLFLYIRSTSLLQTGNGYFCEIANGGAQVWLFDSSRSITPAFTYPTPTTGDTFAVAAVGSTFYVLRNGVVLGSGVDNTFSSGQGILEITDDTAITDVQLSDFKVGSASNSSGGNNANPIYITSDMTMGWRESQTLNAKAFGIRISKIILVPTGTRAAGNITITDPNDGTVLFTYPIPASGPFQTQFDWNKSFPAYRDFQVTGPSTTGVAALIYYR